jgi:hypothetical protein
VLVPFLASAGLALAVARLPILTPDVGGTLATGRVIATSGIPHSDPFSYTLGSKPWTVHEWLADRVLFAAEAAGGLQGVVGLRVALVVVAAAIGYGLARRHASRLVSFACLVPAVWASQRNWLDRPQLWSYALLPLVFGLLERGRATAAGIGAPGTGDARGNLAARRVRSDWLLPPLFALWVNLHGGFMLGLGLLVLWLVCDWWQARQDADAGAVARRRLWLVAACGLATLCNPNGWHGAIYPLRYVGSGLAATIREERAGRLDSGYAWVHLLLAVLLVVTLVRHWRRVPLAHRCVGLVLVALSWPRLGPLALPFAAERHAPLFLFAGTPLLAWQIEVWRGVRGRRAARTAESALATTAAWVAAAVVTLFILWQVGRGWRRDSRSAAQILPGRFPTAAATWLAARPLPPRLLNPYRWGGYLAWALTPRYKVWIDSRGDLYGAERLQEDELLYRMPSGSEAAVRALLQRDAPDVIVWYLLTLDFGSLQVHPFTRWLLTRDDWRLVYWDPPDPARPRAPAATTAVFLRVAPENAALLAQLPAVQLPAGLPR